MYFIYKYIQFVVLPSIKSRDVNMTRCTFRLVLVLKIVDLKKDKNKNRQTGGNDERALCVTLYQY